MVRAIRGILIKCDPAVKAIIEKLDREKHDVIIENLDEEHLVIQEAKLDLVKQTIESTMTKAREIDDDSSAESNPEA